MRKLPIESDTCKCTACNRYFKSTAAFDKHRKDGACRTTEDMERIGMTMNRGRLWVTKGMVGKDWIKHSLFR